MLYVLFLSFKDQDQQVVEELNLSWVTLNWTLKIYKARVLYFPNVYYSLQLFEITKLKQRFAFMFKFNDLTKNGREHNEVKILCL